MAQGTEGLGGAVGPAWCGLQCPGVSRIYYAKPPGIVQILKRDAHYLAHSER
jgi:hypothetical protein